MLVVSDPPSLHEIILLLNRKPTLCSTYPSSWSFEMENDFLKMGGWGGSRASFKQNVRREAVLISLFSVKAACSRQRRQNCLPAQLQNISAPSKTTFSEDSRVTAGNRFIHFTKSLWNTGQYSLLDRCFWGP